MLCRSVQCTLDTLKLILSEIDVVAGEWSGNTNLLPAMKALPYNQIAEKLQVSQLYTVMAHQNLTNTMDPFRYLPHNHHIHLD